MTEPLVLLPGMMCDARLFWPQINALSRDHAVMVAPITRGDTIEEIAEGLLDQLPARFALAGLSMGGIVAMEILRRVPERVVRLCLMDTDPLGETPQIAAMREPWIAQARAGRLDIAMEESLKPAFLAPGPERMTLLRFMYEMAQDLGAELFVRQSRALQRRVDQQDVLRRYRGPTLILCGEHDGLTPVKRHEAMAALMPNARLVIVPEAGHLPTLEQPEAVTQELRAWLDGGDRPPR
ncbi:alpha/beta fold hydrolase [Jhaorihella thermophila]|uniref:Pimeloyl-ACP methyl ester carboxylesterase n=1 Tax=Jhaorihella thermophila TaxID=488547 RepID=A0A1H5X7C9_9RHOB|nr:alpha/beta fold hydrolase [Jhaorihella thermophila]SEG07658.1 Pimeloyl-ACP methyl ester carboxylesterase [Jhaorihella thermophila]